jgi:hypothetical protein
MALDSEETLVVMPQGKRSLAHILYFASIGSPFSWVYFGKNVSYFTELKDQIGNSGKNIPVSELLQGNAKKYRQDFIDYLGSCAAESQDPWWYLTSVSEKNSYISDLYLNFCYLKTFFDVADRYNDRIFVICENPGLLKSIQENSPYNRSIEILPLRNNIQDFFHNCGLKSQKLKNKFVFFMRFILRICLARIVIPIFRPESLPGIQHPVVIHSWADQRSFTLDGHYDDVYFGSLAQKIEEIPREYFFLIDILPTIAYPRALRKMIRVRKPWHLFEEYLSFSDVTAALEISSRVTKHPVFRHTLLNLDISALISEEFLSDQQGARTELSYLYYAVGKRISALHDPASFCYTFENHIWEKMIIRGLKEAGNPRVVGYAHSTVNSMELSYSLSSLERDIIPLPDSILVNGKKPKEILVSSGFDEARIHIVGSLRYGDLSLPAPERMPGTGKNILVILSADINRSLEMISKCGEAFRSCNEVSIIFKPHPIQKLSAIVTLVQQLPGQFSLSTEPLGTLLDATDVVLYSDSTASVEAVARGIPILHVKSDFLIDIGIFEESRIFRSADSPDQIRTFTFDLFRFARGSPVEFRAAIRDLFSPVDDNVLIQEISSGIES